MAFAIILYDNKSGEVFFQRVHVVLSTCVFIPSKQLHRIELRYFV